MRTWALSRATVASTRLAMLNLLVGHHFKALEIGDAEGCRHRDVCCVATASHHNAADAGMVVARVHPVPTPIEKRGGSGSAASARRAGGERPEAASGTTRGAFDWRQPAMTSNDRKDARVNRHHVVVVGAGYRCASGSARSGKPSRFLLACTHLLRVTCEDTNLQGVVPLPVNAHEPALRSLYKSQNLRGL